MIGLTSLGVYNSFFNINASSKNFELYKDTFDNFSFEEIKDEIEEILDISNIISEHLKNDKMDHV